MRVGCGAVGALVVSCTEDTSMPVCESDGGAAAGVLLVVVVVVVVGVERLRPRLYSSCWASRWVERSRHVGMWYTIRSRVMLRVAAKATWAWWQRRRTHAHTHTLVGRMGWV